MRSIAITLLILALTGCTNVMKVSNNVPNPAEYMYNSFDSLSDLDPNLWHFEVRSEERVSFSSTQYYEGTGSLQLTIEDGDWVNRGERAELVLKNSDPMNQIVWYRWAFMIPEDFQDVVEPTQWNLISQWHDQPEDGNWEDHPGRPPMVALYYGNDPQMGPGVQFSYGRCASGYEGSQNSAPFFISKGEWYTVTTHIYWSPTNEGYAQSWIWDGQVNHQFVSDDGNGLFKGPNLYNTAPAYLKLGIYRDVSITTTNSIFFDRFERAGSEGELSELNSSL